MTDKTDWLNKASKAFVIFSIDVTMISNNRMKKWLKPISKGRQVVSYKNFISPSNHLIIDSDKNPIVFQRTRRLNCAVVFGLSETDKNLLKDSGHMCIKDSFAIDEGGIDTPHSFEINKKCSTHNTHLLNIGCIGQTHKVIYDEYRGIHHGAGIRIAVLDVGLDPAHPCLKAPFRRDRKRRSIMAYDYNGETYEETKQAHGKTSHGTEIASLIFGRRSGISPFAKIYIYNVGLRNDSGRYIVSPSRATAALEHLIAAPHGDGPPHIIYMPFAHRISTDQPPLEYEFFLGHVGRLVQKYGIIAIAPTANRAGPGLDFPAYGESVLSVGAVDQTFCRLATSGFNALPLDAGGNPTFAAIGHDVPVANSDKSYRLASGTSYAGAIATGVAAATLSSKQMRGKRNILSLRDRLAASVHANTSSDGRGWGVLRLPHIRT